MDIKVIEGVAHAYGIESRHNKWEDKRDISFVHPTTP
jgi:hypothetical protein